MKNDSTYLRHMLDAIDKIERYIGTVTYAVFVKDDKTVDAVQKELEIIGEAANRLSSAFRRKHESVPWRDMIDMRNVLIHDYFGVIRKTVWKTCKLDLPPLREQLEELLRGF